MIGSGPAMKPGLVGRDACNLVARAGAAHFLWGFRDGDAARGHQAHRR